MILFSAISSINENNNVISSDICYNLDYMDPNVEVIHINSEDIDFD